MGANKLFMLINGQSLLERTIAVCKECFVTVKLVAGHAAGFSSLDIPVVRDNPNARGPMAGVIAALEDCRADRCFVTAADLFDLRAEVIVPLIAQYRDQQYLGVTESNGLQPLCGIYHESSLDTFHRFAKQGDFCMNEAVKTLNHEGVALPEGQWRNLNIPEDLPKAGLND